VKQVRVGVVGATGYGGAESVRLLLSHPCVSLTYVTSETYQNQPLGRVIPSFRGFDNLVCESFSVDEAAKRCDVVFLARTDAGWSMQVTPELLSAGVKVVDFSADFRLQDVNVYAEWYKKEHTAPDLLREAAYGIPELWRDCIQGARLVANPGCYPTSVLLGLAPLLREGLVADVCISSASGVSGAGRSKITVDYHFPEVNESIRPYGVHGHRHRPEIEQGMRLISGREHKISFVPHLAPMTRGILSTMFVALSKPLSQAELDEVYLGFYRGERFVRVLTDGSLPTTAGVCGSNYCHIAAVADPRTQRAVVMSALDNLVKGMSGQAVQNMNLMMGLPEEAGLCQPGVYP
jgi:N-acetyl-gamma-glutamyl-phosphate reductase